MIYFDDMVNLITKTVRTTNDFCGHQPKNRYSSSLLLFSWLSGVIDSSLFLLSEIFPQIKANKFWLLTKVFRKVYSASCMGLYKTASYKKKFYFIVFSSINKKKFNILFFQECSLCSYKVNIFPYPI